MTSLVRAWGLTFAILAIAACSSSRRCPGGGPQAPAGSPDDVHPLTEDAGFTLTGPFDAGSPRLRVTAHGAALPRACHQVDGGGAICYSDGGCDFLFPDGGLVDPDGGCHRTSDLLEALGSALAAHDVGPGGEVILDDGGASLLFEFRDWKNVDPAVQIIGNTLVDAGLAGPVDLEAVTDVVGCL